MRSFTFSMMSIHGIRSFTVLAPSALKTTKKVFWGAREGEDRGSGLNVPNRIEYAQEATLVCVAKHGCFLLRQFDESIGHYWLFGEKKLCLALYHSQTRDKASSTPNVNAKRQLPSQNLQRAPTTMKGLFDVRTETRRLQRMCVRKWSV